MSNLIPEQRVNKHGVTVTKWVRNIPASGSVPPAVARPSLPPVDEEPPLGAALLEEYGWIEISDGTDLKPLIEFSDPDTASGSCWRVTSELIETVDFSDYGFLETPDFANAVGNAAMDKINVEHYALFFGDSNTVIDFTVRQFDPELPFPLVTSFDEWSELMRHHLGNNVGLSVGELDDDGDDDDEYGDY